MIPRVYLSPSSQPANTYAGQNTNEQSVCREIAKQCANALDRCGLDVITGDYGDMYQRVTESNKWPSSLHVPIHTNAHNGKTSGTRTMCYSMGGEGYKACKAIFDRLAPITPGKSENITAHPKLYEVWAADAPTAYIEVDFHDVPSVAAWLVENTEKVGEAIAAGICDYFGVPYVEPSKTFYRVQVGAFNSRELAENYKLEVIEAGFSGAFVVEVNGA